MMPSAASIQPALLARGLRRVLLERGVRIHERTHVESAWRDGRVWLRTRGGIVAAEQAILAINAWASGWPDLSTRVLAWGSYMVVTEPIPDRLAELGWTGGELISDSRFTISYFRTTRDGRIAFGAGVGAAGFGGWMDGTFTDDRHAVERVVSNFDHLFPMLRGVRFEDAWGGPIDITGHRFPEIASDHTGDIHFAHGFAGNGAGPARGLRVASSPRSRPAPTTRSPDCRSSAAASRCCRPSPCATSVPGWSARRSSARTTRSMRGAGRPGTCA